MIWRFPALIKKKIKFTSYIWRFRMEQLQSHIWLTASLYMGKYLRISSNIRRPYLIYDFATAPLWISLYMRKDFLFYQCGVSALQNQKIPREFFEKKLESGDITWFQDFFLQQLWIFCCSLSSEVKELSGDALNFVNLRYNTNTKRLSVGVKNEGICILTKKTCL